MLFGNYQRKLKGAEILFSLKYVFYDCQFMMLVNYLNRSNGDNNTSWAKLLINESWAVWYRYEI